MHIRISDFAGTFPKLHPTKLSDIAAQACHNVMVEHGILSPAKNAVQSYMSNVVGHDKFISAIFFQSDGVTYKKFSNALTTFVFSPVHESYRLYWTTEDASRPLMFADWDEGSTGVLESDNFEYKAGMPPIDVESITVTGISAPPVKPVVSDTSGGSGTAPAATYTTEGALSEEILAVLKKIYDAQTSASGDKPLSNEISDAVVEALQVDDARDARIYAFTYVNRFGDESVPSVKEQIYYLNKDDQPIIAIGYASGTREILARDYGVSAIRLYRSVTDSLGGAQFLFVKEVNFTLSGTKIEITDTLPKGSLLLGEPLPTINYDPPRVGMKGLGVTDYGVGYAFIDKTICFSEPYILYAWPRFYELSTQHDIMGMGHYDSTIVVATKGNPVLISGNSPESMNITSLPLYEGCVSPRSMVNLNYGCMYASENGLVLVTTNSAKLLTENVFATTDWQKIKPSSIHACAYKNGYLFFWNNGTKKGSGYLDLNNASKGILWFNDYALNTFLNDGVVQMISLQTDVFNSTKSIYAAFNPEYGQDFTSKRFIWRSKTFNLSTPKRMLAAQVIADDYSTGAITFRVYANDILLHETLVSNARPFRIKNHSAKHDFSIEVEASSSIREIALGETMRDLIK